MEKDPLQAVNKIVILIEREKQTKTKSGIIIENQVNREPFAVGKVVSTGNGIEMNNGKFQTPPVKKGDTVLYDKNKCAMMNGMSYISSDHIVAIVNDEAALPTGYYETN